MTGQPALRVTGLQKSYATPAGSLTILEASHDPAGSPTADAVIELRDGRVAAT